MASHNTEPPYPPHPGGFPEGNQQWNMPDEGEAHQKRLPFNIVFIFGPPGAGKGTLCSQVARDLGYYHLSAGDYLRELAGITTDDKSDQNKQGSDSQQQQQQQQQPQKQRPPIYPLDAYADMTPFDLRECIRQGEHVEDSTIVKMLKWKLEKEYDNGKGGWKVVLLDGFPRNDDSAVIFENEVDEPCMAIKIMCERPTAESRFLSRGREKTDTPQKYRMRYFHYSQKTGPVMDRYSRITTRVSNMGDIKVSLREMKEYLEAQFGTASPPP